MAEGESSLEVLASSRFLKTKTREAKEQYQIVPGPESGQAGEVGGRGGRGEIEIHLRKGQTMGMANEKGGSFGAFLRF